MIVNESFLRSIIKRVLLESLEAGSIENLTAPENISKYTDKSFEDFLCSKSLSMSEEDREKLLKLFIILLETYIIDGGSYSFYGRDDNAPLTKENSLKREFEIAWVYVEEEIFLRPDRDEFVNDYNYYCSKILGRDMFSSVNEIFQFMKTVGDSKESFGANASRFLIDNGCVISNDSYNLNIVKDSMSTIDKACDFFEVVKELEGVRDIIVKSLSSGKLVDMYMKFAHELGVDVGDNQKSFIELASEFEGDYDLNISIYDAGSPSKLMRMIHEYLSKLSYLNDTVGRF